VKSHSDNRSTVEEVMESEIGVGDGLRIEESNLTRDTWIRYLGYANEIGESFKRFISRRSYLASYLASSGYVVADAYYQCQKELERDSGEGSRIRVALQAGDSLIWQALASVIVPGICINRIVALTSSACKLGMPVRTRILREPSVDRMLVY